jgi:thiol-disulfide isomerase/thioredoxin
LGGNPVNPLAQADGHAVVLIFLSVDCPICNRYAPEIRRLHDEYRAKGIKFWLVYPNADPESILKHHDEYKLPADVLRDPAHSLVGLSKASVTPEAAVFLPDGRLVYHGRIDNRDVDLGLARPEATEHDLRQVLERVIRGEAVKPSSTRAVGCYIPRVE